MVPARTGRPAINSDTASDSEASVTARQPMCTALRLASIIERARAMASFEMTLFMSIALVSGSPESLAADFAGQGVRVVGRPRRSQTQDQARGLSARPPGAAPAAERRGGERPDVPQGRGAVPPHPLPGVPRARSGARILGGCNQGRAGSATRKSGASGGHHPEAPRGRGPRSGSSPACNRPQN